MPQAKFLISFIFDKVANFHKQNNRHLNLAPHLKKHRESNALLLMEFVVIVDEGDVMLVQFTSSLVVLLGWHYEVCGSTPTVSQTQLAAYHDIKLWRSNCLTTWPRSLLFSLVVKYAVRDDGSSLAAKAAKSVIRSRTIKKKTYLISITNRSQWRLWSLTKCFLFS